MQPSSACGAAIHSVAPAVHLNAAGLYEGSAFHQVRAALYRGAWTVAFVLAGPRLTDIGTARVIYDGPRPGDSSGIWANVGSSVGGVKRSTRSGLAMYSRPNETASTRPLPILVSASSAV